MTALRALRAERSIVRDSQTERLPGTEGEVGLVDVYAEDTFRYFLGLERKRAERSGLSFLLLLVEFEPRVGQPADLERQPAHELFSLLLPCVRETDFIGWYQERRIVGAVLTQFGEASIADVSRLISERVSSAIERGISQVVASRLHVRVHQLPSSVGRG